MGIHESAEEVLVLADYSGTGLAGQSHRPYARVSRSAVYLHAVLEMAVRDCWQLPSHLSRADLESC